MTEIRKAVLEVCKIAEIADEWSYNKYASYPDYDLTDIDEWKTFIKHRMLHALRRYGKPYHSCNKRMEQETIQFTTTELRSKIVITAIVSWIEKNYQTGTIHLQTASCTRIFGNRY